MKSIKWICMTVSLLLCLSGALYAAKGGLRTNYSKIVVGNLPIGNTLSMSKIANAPLIIGNNHDVPIKVSISVRPPKKIQKGYEPIPDTKWVQIESNNVNVSANSQVKLDVLVKIPDDEKLFGKKYQCDIYLLTKGAKPTKGIIQYGFEITGMFLFSIAPGRNEEGLARVLKDPANAAYSVNPPKNVLWNVKPGQIVEIKTPENKWIELKNSSKKRQRYFLSSVNPADTEFKIHKKSHFPGNVDDVLIDKDEIILRAGQNRALKIKVKVPEDADFKSGPLAYLVAIKSGTRQGVTRYLSIYLNDVEKLEMPEKQTSEDEKEE